MNAIEILKAEIQQLELSQNIERIQVLEMMICNYEAARTATAEFCARLEEDRDRGKSLTPSQRRALAKEVQFQGSVIRLVEAKAAQIEACRLQASESQRTA